MAKKKPTKKKQVGDCNCCHCNEFAPVFYYAGDGKGEDWDRICAMVKQGVRVYALVGKPGCPNPNGCQ